MAKIEKRGKGYRITVSNGYDANGKQIRETLTYIPTETAPTKIQKELQRVSVDFERRIKEGAFIDGDKTTFAEFVQRWDRDYASDRDNIGQKNYEDAMRFLKSRIIPAIGSMKLNQIKAPNLMDIYKQMEAEGKRPKTIKKAHSFVSSVFSLAYDYGVIADNPCGRCRLPKDKTPYKYTILDTDQLRHFTIALDTEYRKKASGYKYKDESGQIQTGYTWRTETIDPMFQLFFTLALNTGTRRGELCALTWEDIDFKARIMHIRKAVEYTKATGLNIKAPKTVSSIRDVPLNDECIRRLKIWQAEEKRLSFIQGTAWVGHTGKSFNKNYLFIQDTGAMVHLQTPEKKMNKMIQDYNEMHGEELIPHLRLHDLRHTFATHLIANNADVITVSKILGHSSPSVTLDIYANHALPERAPDVTDLFQKIAYTGTSG